MSDTDYMSIAEEKLKNALTLEKIEELKKNSPVGKMIKFNYILTFRDGRMKSAIINGPIEAVYPYTFRCEGKTFKWVDYAMGYIY